MVTDVNAYYLLLYRVLEASAYVTIILTFLIIIIIIVFFAFLFGINQLNIKFKFYHCPNDTSLAESAWFDVLTDKICPAVFAVVTTRKKGKVSQSHKT